MARDEQSLKIKSWAESGDRAEPEAASPVLDRAEGWTSVFSQVGGEAPQREVFNQLFREITGMLVELNKHGGLLEWSSGQDYEHPAFVTTATGKIYVSTRASGPNEGGAVNPISNSPVRWAEVPGAASLTERGVVELASVSETQAGSDATRAVTPAGLAQLTATTGRRGLVEVATVAEAQTSGNSLLAVSPAGARSLRRIYRSPDITWQNVDNISFWSANHNLGGVPDWMQCQLKFNADGRHFDVGTIIGNFTGDSDDEIIPIKVWATATQVGLRLTTSSHPLQFSGGSIFPSNTKLRVLAFRFVG